MSSFNKFLLKAFGLFCLVNFSGLWTVTFVQYRNLKQLETLQRQSAQLQRENQLLTEGLLNPTQQKMISPVASITPYAATPQPTPKSVTASPSPTPTPSPVVVSVPTAATTTKSSTTAQEAVIFMGSGQTTDTNWTDIPGAAVTLNPSEYGQITGLTFEASLGIIGGEAHARLINSQTKAIVAVSSVTNNTSTATWKISPLFQPFPGTVNYMVQLRSTSGETAYLTGARLRVKYRNTTN